MKYLVMLGDGMADRSVPELSGKTPLEVANIPNMDFLAQNGDTGMVITVPIGMPPGSDTANLSVMGYAPDIYYTGRSPLEAVSMGIDLADTDLAFRCNLVTISHTENYQDAVMIDYSAGEISTAESNILITYLNEEFKTQARNLYAGVSYRHCLVLNNAQTGTDCTPPHDITLKPIKEHLPKGRYADEILELMIRSKKLLEKHPINIARVEKGLNPANSCWFWGEGTRPALTAFKEKFGVSGRVISAVDLIKGIGLCAKLNSVDVEGATGTVHTNFDGKATACIDAFKAGDDFVYLHVEAPDECGHQHDVQGKVRSVELIDEKILTPILSYLRASGEDFKVLLTPDHSTPLETRTHSSEAIPFVIYSSNTKPTYPALGYTEALAKETGYFVPVGSGLMEKLID